MLLAYEGKSLHPPFRRIAAGSMEVAIFTIVVGLFAIMAQQPDAAAGKGADRKPATPATANLVALFSTDDYPKEAIRNGEEGTVGVTLTVSSDGKVADCVVNQTSGSPSLDAQTCRIMWTRAQFTPARDAYGRPVQDTFVQRIRWELPEGNPNYEERSSRLILALDTEGEVTDCRYESSPARESFDPHCPDNIEAMRQFILSAPNWIPFAGREMVFETQQRVGDPHDGLELGERPGEFQLGVSRLYLTIDDGGKVKSCSRDSWGPIRPRGEANFTCEFAQRWRFDELPKRESNRNDRQLTVVNAAYLRKPQAAPATN